MIRNLLLAVAAIFAGSWLFSTGTWLMSLPSDAGVIGGLAINVFTILGLICLVGWRVRIVRRTNERKHNA